MSLTYDEDDYLVPAPIIQHVGPPSNEIIPRDTDPLNAHRQSYRRGSNTRRPSVTLLDPPGVTSRRGSTSRRPSVTFSTHNEIVYPESPTRRTSGTLNTHAVTGYCVCPSWKYFWYLVSVASLGVGALVFYISPYLWVRAAYRKCHLKNAEVVAVETPEQGRSVCYIRHIPGDGKRFYTHCNIRYIWDNYLGTFSKLSAFAPGISCKEILQEYSGGIDPVEFPSMRQLFGPNILQQQQSWLLLNIFEPTFTIFSLGVAHATALWICLEVWYMVITLVLLNVTGMAVRILRTYRLRRKILERYNSSQTDYVLKAIAHGMTSTLVSWRSLVPGCVVEIPAEENIHFDGILISGTLVVDESLLSGSHTPVPKAALVPTDEVYCPKQHTAHTVFAGSTVLQTSPGTLVLVIATGHNTRKSHLMESLLNPKYKPRFCLRYESYFTVIVIIVYVFIAANLLSHFDEKVPDIIMPSLTILALALPCFFPITLVVSSVRSEYQLESQGIVTRQGSDIIDVGRTNLVAFDKTGTLTKPKCEVAGVLPVGNKRLTTVLLGPIAMEGCPITKAMATCHRIKVGETMSEDWLDEAIFSSTKWILLEPGIESLMVPTNYCKMPLSIARDFTGEHEVGVLYHFPFSHHLGCMSVVVQDNRDHDVVVYTKGAPDAVLRLCQQISVPSNTHDILTQYTKMGYRVIATATRTLSDEERVEFLGGTLERSQVETYMTFLGFVALYNPTKDEAPEVIEELREADIRTIIVSGDAVNTVIRCGHDCGVISSASSVTTVALDRTNDGDKTFYDELQVIDQTSRSQSNLNVTDKKTTVYVIHGDTFATLQYAEKIEKVKKLLRTNIYGNMAPLQKHQLIDFLKKVGYYICMCGDGYNDSSALTCAHTGLVLSAEKRDILSDFHTGGSVLNVLYVLREGRHTLACAQNFLKHHMLCGALMATVFLTLSIVGVFISIPHIASIAAICVFLPSLLECISPARGPLSSYQISTFLHFALSMIGAMLLYMGAVVAMVYFIQTQPWCDTSDSPHQPHLCRTSSYLTLSLAWFSLSSYIVVTKARTSASNVLQCGFVSPSLCVVVVLLGVTFSSFFWHDFARAAKFHPCAIVVFNAVILAFWLGTFLIHWIFEAYIVDATILGIKALRNVCRFEGNRNQRDQLPRKPSRHEIVHLVPSSPGWPPPMADIRTPDMNILGRRKFTTVETRLSYHDGEQEGSGPYDEVVENTYRQIKEEYLEVLHEHHDEDTMEDVLASMDSLRRPSYPAVLDIGEF